MENKYRAELVGVFGDPVDDNPTIAMMEAGFRELGLFYRYITVRVCAEDLGSAMEGMRAFHMRGVNLTMPHKVSVLPYLDELSPAARIIGAVNTVVRRGDMLFGDNTDGKGFMTAVQKAGFQPEGKRIAVLGAGGAARAICVELALAGVGHITVFNRNEARGASLAHVLNEKTNTEASYQKWEGHAAIPDGTDLIVNATTIGMPGSGETKPAVDFSSVARGTLAADVVFLPETPFLKEAAAHGAITADGLGMLVYQGAIAFELWTGHAAPLETMHAAIKTAFGLK